ncbi:unnamed protein product [Allacma fusca]|uniref:Uncharacterized protein n=1 Tax=Allacma fusca TaxID=39272 RepID=A0A8J2KWM3_9HEXA|nr:unnamed protein product [Allacma fusca]
MSKRMKLVSEADFELFKKLKSNKIHNNNVVELETQKKHALDLDDDVIPRDVKAMWYQNVSREIENRAKAEENKPVLVRPIGSEPGVAQQNTTPQTTITSPLLSLPSTPQASTIVQPQSVSSPGITIDQVLAAVFSKCAKQIIAFLIMHSIGWNGSGEVTIRMKRIPQSSYVSVLRALTDPRKNNSAIIGYKDVQTVLKGLELSNSGLSDASIAKLKSKNVFLIIPAILNGV